MNPTLTLENTAYTLAQIPAMDAVQIALAGRSNVGKSSLVNALAGRRKLAKVSSVPGKTRSINFYRAEPFGFYLVDLPGYGYARASHEERRAWGNLLQKYLAGNKQLKALALLIDSRLPPQKLDLDLASFARQCGLPILPVLTKADKCKQRERAARAAEWRDIVGIMPIVTSSEKKLGIPALWDALARAAGARPRRVTQPRQRRERREKRHEDHRSYRRHELGKHGAVLPSDQRNDGAAARRAAFRKNSAVQRGF